MGEHGLASRSAISKGKGRHLLRLAAAGVIAVGSQVAVTGSADAAPTEAIAVSAPLAVTGSVNAAPTDSWDRLAQCESGGNWGTDTGNGYYGGFQFNATTWMAFGGQGLPHQASRTQQITVAERVLAEQGWNAWPACSTKMGLH